MVGLAALGAARAEAARASDAVSRAVVRMLRGIRFLCGFLWIEAA